MDACLARRKTAARAGVSWQGTPGNRIFMKENKINRRNNMEFLWEGVMAITPQQVVMYLIGGLFDLAGGQKGIRTGAASADGIRRDHGKPAIIRRH